MAKKPIEPEPERFIICSRCSSPTLYTTPYMGYHCCPACKNEMKSEKRKQAKRSVPVTAEEAIRKLNTGEARVRRS